MPTDTRDRTDLVLMPRQFATSKDMTKGNLVVYVGPFRTSLSETDRLIVMDKGSGLLREASQTDAVQAYTDVAEGEYVVMTNPALSDKNTSPEPKKSNDIVELQMGRRVNLPGPLSFPLWPFQTVKVIPGHQLQLNQFAVVRVLNEEEAIRNWAKAIIKPQTGTESKEPKELKEPLGKTVTRPDTLSVGQLIIIKGTEVSFYIPPTGLEVVPDEHGKYVREAETLEQLEYCVLVDQSGEKRYIQGPNVVFPKPSEQFVAEGAKRKFKAIELTEISGIHIKVTAAYKDGDREYKAGDELFITGKAQPIYFPRAEHAIIRYDSREAIHFATAVPKGEGRYLLNRTGGEVGLAKGPKMLLPDPRSEVIVRRILTERQVKLWYPGNVRALEVNLELAGRALERGTSNYLSETAEEVMYRSRGLARSRESAQRLVGEEMERRTAHTPPRSITLDTKYDGAVQVDIWTGYAVLVVDKTGKREVVQGPQTILLEFDQTLAYMELSMGKPKSTDNLLQTAFLRVSNNRVSDIISVETADMVKADVKVSYRADFEGDSSKWFGAENYVKLLCDHGRSIIRNMAKKHGIEEFSSQYIDLVRNTILGVKSPAAGGQEEKKRPGMPFSENGMRVYDVEILELKIGDSTIAGLLVSAQHKAVQDALELVQTRRKLEITKQQEQIAQETAEASNETVLKKLELEGEKTKAEFELAMYKLGNETVNAAARLKGEAERQKIVDLIHGADLAREKNANDLDVAQKEAEVALEIKRIVSETAQLAERTKAVSPDLIAALQAFSNADLVEKVAKAMAPMAILGGESVADILGKLLKGTGLEGLIGTVATALTARSIIQSRQAGARTETDGSLRGG